jgi:hypothetical protein
MTAMSVSDSEPAVELVLRLLNTEAGCMAWAIVEAQTSKAGIISGTTHRMQWSTALAGGEN